MNYPERPERSDQNEHLLSMPRPKVSQASQSFIASRRGNELATQEATSQSIVHAWKHHYPQNHNGLPQSTALCDSTTSTIVDAISDAIHTALLIIDHNGLVIHLNRNACKLLDVSHHQINGKSVKQLFSGNPPLLTLLESGNDYENKQLRLKHCGNTIYSSGRILRNPQGDIIGALAILRSTGVQRTELRARYQLDDLLGNSSAMDHCRQMADIAASSPSTVLIHGESGTGKELLAQGIHNASERCQQPFVAINCAALAETLLESELFGYAEGAFTGAKKGGQAGKVEIANGGTLFLDEIGDMPLPMQVKLLRMLQERRICRVGCSEEISVDLRIIAATHKDLNKEIKAGSFRRDLYYRLNVLTITIAPLRERTDDLKPLIRFMVEKFSQRLNKQVRLDSSFIAACRNYPWPGNVRELENSIERAINLTANGGALNKESLVVDPIELTAVTEEIDGVLPLKQIELEMITRALATARGNILHASNLLGISRNTIYRKIKEHDIVL